MTVDEILENIRWPRKFSESEGRVLYALKNYQIVELVLKQYLIRKVAGDRKRVQAIRSLTLGKLIDRFKQDNANADLHKLLSDVREDRNMIAHQALVLQKLGVAEMMGMKALDIYTIRAIDSRALKVMTETVLEFARTEQIKSQS